MATQEQKTVQVKPQANLPAALTDVAAWGGGQVVTSQDIIIPKILPLQFMSEKVKSNEGKYGEFRDTLSNELLGDLENPVEVIPFYMEKKWLEFSVVTNKAGARKREYKQMVPIQDNPTLPGYNDSLQLVEGDVERDRCMDFYVLIPSQVVTDTALPYVLSFRRTSLKAGKKLATQMFIKNAQAGKVPAAVVMNLSGKTVQNDDGEFVVQDVAPNRAASEDEVRAALRWLTLVRKGATKLDESEFVEK